MVALAIGGIVLLAISVITVTFVYRLRDSKGHRSDLLAGATCVVLLEAWAVMLLSSIGGATEPYTGLVSIVLLFACAAADSFASRIVLLPGGLLAAFLVPWFSAADTVSSAVAKASFQFGVIAAVGCAAYGLARRHVR